ncbi:unannotated protein [freshwater metagenome]|uniref:Unannotated protein n=1 Tax=freshwater metagenome TaxID=449393 RepID=A0A6J7C9N3_9ZZZZ
MQDAVAQQGFGGAVVEESAGAGDGFHVAVQRGQVHRQVEVWAAARCFVAVVVEVEERGDVVQCVGHALGTGTGVVGAFPGVGGGQCLFQLDAAGFVEHEPADEGTVVGTVHDQRPVGFGRRCGLGNFGFGA